MWVVSGTRTQNCWVWVEWQKMPPLQFSAGNSLLNWHLHLELDLEHVAEKYAIEIFMHARLARFLCLHSICAYVNVCVREREREVSVIVWVQAQVCVRLIKHLTYKFPCCSDEFKAHYACKTNTCWHTTHTLSASFLRHTLMQRRVFRGF